MVTFMARASLLTDLPVAFRWLFAGTFVNRAGTFVAPFLVLYLTGERGHSPVFAGAALAAWGAGGLLATPAAGFAADRYGRRITLLVCMLGAGLSLATLGAARAPWLILLAAFLSGATADAFRPASNAIVADVVPPELRPRAYSATFWATNLGFSLAALTGGALAAAGWWWLFAVDAASCVGFGLLIFTRIPETRPERKAGELDLHFGVILRDRLLLVMALLFLIQGVLLFQAFSTLPLAMDADGLTPTTYGIVLAANGIVIILVQPLVSDRLGRMRRSWVLAASLLAMGLGLWATAVAETAPVFAVTVVSWSFGEIMFAAVSLATVVDLAPVHARGRYTSVVWVAAGMSFTIGPLASTAVYELAGEGVVWALCGALGMLGALLALTADGSLRRRLSPGSPRAA
jgi:MFS family permease